MPTSIREKIGHQRTEIWLPLWEHRRLFGRRSQRKTFENISCLRKENALVGFIGGPPCPDFSVAGKNRGQEGDNGRLSRSYIDMIVDQLPDFFVLKRQRTMAYSKASCLFRGIEK